MNLMFGHLFQSVSKRNFLFRFKIVTNLSNRNNRERPAIKKSNLECVKDPTPFIYLSKIVQMNVLSGGSVKHHNGSLEFYHRHRTFISFIHSFWYSPIIIFSSCLVKNILVSRQELLN